MIEKIIEWSTKNRFIVLFVYIIISGFGVYTMVRMPVDAIPDLSENQVIVYTEWMGVSPEVIEEQLTFPIVSALQGIAEVKDIRASSMFGMSFIFVIFSDATDLYFARTLVSERLNTIRSSLPPNVSPVLGPDGSGVGHVFWYTVEGKGYDLGSLRAIQDWYIRYQLASVTGVAEVASVGGFVRQYQIDVDPVKLRSFGLTINDITSAVRQSNSVTGGNVVEQNDAELFVRGSGYITSVSDIEKIVVKSGTNGAPILLSRVANVRLGAESRRGALEKNGEGEVVGGIVVMRNGENARDVIRKVKEKIEQIQAGLPEGVRIIPAYDRSSLIDEAVATLESALLESAIIVSLLVGIFLLHIRSIIRIIIEIPVTVLLSFIFMWIFNITSNIMSIGGIILAVGVIVDSSIVMVENAYRNASEALIANPDLSSEDYRKVAVLSAKQVGRAIFFSELIMLLAFLPVFLLSGQEGKLFHPLAATKSFMLLASSIVSITLIPVLMTLFLRGKMRDSRKNPITGFFQKIYEPVIRWVLHHRKITIAVNIVALIIAVPLALSTGSEFMPPLDEGSLLFMPVALPQTSITEMNRILRMQDAIIKTQPEVQLVLGKTGRAETATDNAPLSMIETIILLKPKSEWREGITKKDIIQELDSKLQIPGVRNGWTQPIINRISMLSTGIRTDLGLKIYGPNLDTLQFYAIKAESIIQLVKGASDVTAERMQNGFYLDITLNRDALAQYGLRIEEMQMFIETAIGGTNAGTVLEGRSRFPIQVRFSRDNRSDLEGIRRLPVPVSVLYAGSQDLYSSSPQRNTNAPMGTMGNAPSVTSSPPSSVSSMNSNLTYLPLSTFADISIKESPAMISSENGMLRSVVVFNPSGRDLGSVFTDARDSIEAGLQLPKGYSYEWSGQYESKIRAQNTLMIITPIVFLLIYMFLYFTLKSYTEAAVVMLSVPFALIGGVYIISALGYNFSVAVWVGFIALYGIAVETGVVMVLYLHEALDKRIIAANSGLRGPLSEQDIYDAAFDGSVLRLRPKLMTVLTSMIGLIPVMWATGTGADVMKPLTAPMIGGLLTSAVHVLVVTPVLFVIMKRHALRKGTLSLSKMTYPEAAE